MTGYLNRLIARAAPAAVAPVPALLRRPAVAEPEDPFLAVGPPETGVPATTLAAATPAWPAGRAAPERPIEAARQPLGPPPTPHAAPTPGPEAVPARDLAPLAPTRVVAERSGPKAPGRDKAYHPPTEAPERPSVAAPPRPHSATSLLRSPEAAATLGALQGEGGGVVRPPGPRPPHPEVSNVPVAAEGDASADVLANALAAADRVMAEFIGRDALGPRAAGPERAATPLPPAAVLEPPASTPPVTRPAPPPSPSVVIGQVRVEVLPATDSAPAAEPKQSTPAPTARRAFGPPSSSRFGLGQI